MTIDNNFWCSDTTALDILTERLQHSEQSNHSLYSFFKQRAQIEEDYGKQLLKLSESIIFHDDIECLEILPTTTEVMARAHIELGQNIKHLIEVPLHSFVSEHSILKTKITQQMHESQLTKLLHSDNVKKVEHEYITECKKPIVDVPFVSILDKEYQIAIDIMQINSPSWIDNWRESCRTMQDVEEKRMDYMKSLCISFASMISYTYCIDDQTCDHTLVAVKEFNPKLEMEMFIKEHATGSIPPDIPKYTKYKDSSIHPPTKKITEINIPNKKDEQLRSIDEQLMKLPLTDIRHTTRLYTPQEYPLNPAYKPSKNDAGSNAILSKWYETYRRYSNDTHMNNKTVLTMSPYESTEKSTLNTNHDHPEHSPSKRSPTFFSAIGLRKKKGDKKPMNVEVVDTYNQDTAHEYPHSSTPPSPLFSHMDFYCSTSNFHKSIANAI